MCPSREWGFQDGLGIYDAMKKHSSSDHTGFGVLGGTVNWEPAIINDTLGAVPRKLYDTSDQGIGPWEPFGNGRQFVIQKVWQSGIMEDP